MFTIHTMSEIPLYQQIVDQMKELVFKGYLVQGDQIPSVREMAKILSVNTSTVSRAYKELESIGMIQAVVGKGTFISFNQEMRNAEKQKVLKQLEHCVKEAKKVGATTEEIRRCFEGLGKEEKREI